MDAISYIREERSTQGAQAHSPRKTHAGETNTRMAPRPGNRTHAGAVPLGAHRACSDTDCLDRSTRHASRRHHWLGHGNRRKPQKQHKRGAVCSECRSAGDGTRVRRAYAASKGAALQSCAACRTAGPSAGVEAVL